MRTLSRIFVVVPLLAGLAGCVIASEEPTGSIASSLLPQGVTVTLANGYRATGTIADDAGITHFVAIPYAAPPINTRRWTAPIAWSVDAGTPANPGNPASSDFDPAGLGAWKLPRCIQSMGAEGLTGSTFAIPGAIPPGDGGPGPQSIQSENCLYLNVFTKYANTAASKPVFVWIHGGANVIGSAMSALYDPTPHPAPTTPAFMQTVDAVVVTINYRMGPFGFLAHPSLTAEAGTSGTYGVLDQIEALKWVKANVANFGGNPNNVTVFGESAGAFDINILSASPLAAGLFSRTIQQSVYNFPLAWASNFSTVLTTSGNAINAAALQISPFDSSGNPKWPTLADQEHLGTGLATVLTQPCPSGVDAGQAGAFGGAPWGSCGYPSLPISGLRSLPAGIVQAGYENAGVAGTAPAGLGIFSVGPPIDNRLLTAQPLQVLKSSSAAVPSISGTNKDEFTSLLLTFSLSVNMCGLVSNSTVPCSGGNLASVNLLKPDGSGYKRMMQDVFGISKGASAFATLPTQYKPKNSSNQVDYSNARGVRDAWVSLLTDAVFTCQGRRNAQYTARASATRGNSYRYQFTYQPSLLENATMLGNARALGSGYLTSTTIPVAWFPQMGALHGLDVGFVMGFEPSSWYFEANSGYSPDGDSKTGQSFQASWGQFGASGTVTIPSGSGVWSPYPTTGTSDPVLLINTSLSATQGTLSSVSGENPATGTPTSQCDWIDQYASYP